MRWFYGVACEGIREVVPVWRSHERVCEVVPVWWASEVVLSGQGTGRDGGEGPDSEWAAESTTGPASGFPSSSAKGKSRISNSRKNLAP